MTTLTQERTTTTPTADVDPVVDVKLISSDRIDDTRIFDKAGEHIGSVRKLMINPVSGRVEFVLMGFGGLFGMGEDFYPVPFETLSYDPRVEGYRLDYIAKDDLNAEKAPSLSNDNDIVWNSELARKSRLFYLNAVA